MRFLTAAVALTLVVLPGLTNTVPASPLDLSQVRFDAIWVAHLDVDALWETTIIEKGWERMLDTRPDAKERLNELRERIGMDITKDIHSVTAYGSELRPDNAVLILHAKVNRQMLLNLAENAPDHKTEKYRRHEIHTWTAQQRGRSRTIAVSLFKSNAVVMASNRESLQGALDVLAGRERGVFPDSPLAGKASPGAVMLVRVWLSEPDLPGRLQALRQMDSLWLTIGENKGEMFVDAEAEMDDAEAAGSAKAMLDGFRTMAVRAAGDNPEASKMLDALSMKVEGDTLTLEWSAPADEVWEMANEFAERAAERRAARRSVSP